MLFFIFDIEVISKNKAHENHFNNSFLLILSYAQNTVTNKINFETNSEDMTLSFEWIKSMEELEHWLKVIN